MYWSYTETEDHELFIHLGGLDDKGRTVHCRIDNFTPFVYLELPKRIKWNKVKCQTLFDFYQQRYKSEGPLEFRMFQKYKIHYKKSVNVMFLTFSTDANAKKFGNRIPRNNASIYGLGSFGPGEFKVHESHSIDPIIKFTATRNITLASWVKLEEYIPESETGLSIEERKFTTADIDLYCDWRNVHPYTPKDMIIVQPKYCSFDIECYSKNHNSRMPDPEQAENVVFQIALIFGTLRNPKQRRVLLTMFHPDDIDGVEVIRFATERELMLHFTNLINEEDPDIFITYNGMKFDWDYLITRADRGGFYPKFAKMSRIIGERAERMVSSWGSNAYGQQEFKYLNCHGRTNVDVLLEVERNFKLSIYSLNAVSENFLKENKVDITPKQLFMLYRINHVMLPLLKDCKAVTASHFSKLLKQADSLLPPRECHGIVKELRATILGSETVKQLYDNIREGIRITGVYCVQDTALPIKLVDKLNLWPTMEEMSNCMSVPMSYLHTRGQQVKVISQIFRRTMTNNLIFSQGEGEVTKYQGATVIDANAGDYDNVAVLDFASLYPTVMIAYNICYTTLVADDDPIPDSECHVLEWESHRGCLAEGTLVSVGNTLVPIEELATHRGKLWALDNERLGEYNQTDFFDQGIKECVQITLEDGTTLTCTPDHRIYTSNGWVEAGNLIQGDSRVMVGHTPVRFDSGDSITVKKTTYTDQQAVVFMKLLGLLCSDGSTTKNQTLVYSGHLLDVEDVRNDVMSLIGVRPPYRKNGQTWTIPLNGELGEQFRSLDGLLVGRKYGQVRTLPSILDTVSVNLLRAFLSGLFGGDGHTLLRCSTNSNNLGSVQLSWSSPEEHHLTGVFDKLQEYLTRCGIETTIYRKKEETILRVLVKDLLVFTDTIGFSYCVHKQVRLRAGSIYYRKRNNMWLQRHKIVSRVRELKTGMTIEKALQKAYSEIVTEPVYSLPYITMSRQQVIELLRPRAEKCIIQRPDSKFLPSHMDFIEQIGAKSVFDGYGVHRDETTLPLFSVMVVDVRPVGKRHVYDLEVMKSQSFVANGIVVHNCSHDKKKRSSKIKKEDILCGEYRYRFKRVKVHPDGTLEGVGILPELLRHLLVQRKKVKKVLAGKEALLKMTKGTATPDELEQWKSWKMKIVEPGTLSQQEISVLEVEIGVLDAEQKALKVSANSVYGALGTKKGLLSFTAGAASVTAMSRHLIITAITWILKKYADKCTFKGVPCKPKLVYGDSVTGDTPIMVRDSRGLVRIVRIDALEQVVNGEWQEYPLFKLDGAIRTEKQMIDTSDTSFETWTANGWAPLRKVIKHKVNKRIYRVRTDTSYVDVTEDHSLLSPTLQKIKASDIVIDSTKLRTGFPSDVSGVMVHNDSYSTAVEEQCDYFSNPVKGDGIVKSVTLLYDVGEYNDYVYDIETADGTFQAGVGEIIVKNTDSAMLEFVGADTAQTFDLAAESSHMATHVLKCEIMGVSVDALFGGKTLDVLTDKDLPNLTDDEKCKYYYYKSIPIDFEFENVYGRYLLLTMKRYAAYVVNRNGKILSTTKKGVSVARRDNCKYLRDTYMAVLEAILSRKSEEVAMNIITDRINMLFTRQIPDIHLVIYVGISSVINYAKSKDIITLHGTETVYLDANGNPIDGVTGPEDPRLVYSNVPQSILAQKMMRRGDIVPANTRLEFLYLDPGYEVAHQGEKAEDYMYYKENRRHEQLRPDLLFYIEKQLLKPLTELITVKYKHELIVFETVDERFARLSKQLFKKSALLKDKIEKKKNETRIITQGSEEERIYSFKGTAAKVEHALRYLVSTRANHIHPVHDAEFIEACRAWKARAVLDAIYKKHDLDKRPKRITRVGDKLHVGCKVVYWKDERRGHIVSVEKLSTEVEKKRSLAKALDSVVQTRTVETVTFTIMLDDEETISGVKREEVSPLYRRDSTVIKDILGYRRGYRAVVQSLNEMFSPLLFK